MKFPDCVIKELPAERIIGTTVLLGDPPFDPSEVGPLFDKVAEQIRASGGDLHVGVGLYSDSEAGTEVTCGYRTNSGDDSADRIGLSTTGSGDGSGWVVELQQPIISEAHEAGPVLNDEVVGCGPRHRLGDGVLVCILYSDPRAVGQSAIDRAVVSVTALSATMAFLSDRKRRTIPTESAMCPSPAMPAIMALDS